MDKLMEMWQVWKRMKINRLECDTHKNVKANRVEIAQKKNEKTKSNE
jgi:hypothetical protein